MATSFSSFDIYGTACPEREDAPDWADTVGTFINADADAIDQVLELLGDLYRRADARGIGRDFADAADRVVDLIQVAEPGFKRTDRLVMRRKAVAK